VLFELLDDPPRRSGEGDVAAHARMKHANHTTVASPNERARVAVLGEVAETLIVVENGDFDGLLAKLGANVGL